MPPQRIPLGRVNDLSEGEFVSRFGSLYEHAPWVAEQAWEARPFASLHDLRAAMAEAVRAAPEKRKMDLIRAHPDLAGKAAVAGELTRESEGEQASAGLDRLSPQEYEAFTRMNREYREKFGFPMIVAVREHANKESILRNAKERLGHSGERETETALDEIHKIARLRLEDLIEDER
jgi:2-oxo-4-hydroxy-4-carboxy-5-ureidoimidazoline decarboxylase